MPESNTWSHQITTPYNACSLETLPPLPDGDGGELIPLVVGCYQLNESSSDEIPGDNADHADETREKAATRSGELRLYMIRRDLRFKEPCVVPMESGILDGKWKKSSSNGKSPLFASACASGRIHLHSLVHDDKSSLRLDQIASPNVDDGSNVLCLSLAWDDYTQNASDRIVSSYSDGTIALHDVSYSQDEGEQQNIVIEESQRWDAHSMFGCPSEVWTCSFLRGDENVVMSGADDCSIKIWDIRQITKATHKISNEFEAGVTSISSHPSIDYMFAAGSYDEYVRLYDSRMLHRPLWNVYVGGGVWRIKWHPMFGKDDDGKYDKILVAAMHGGCRVVNCTGLGARDSGRNESINAEVVSSFTAHKSMAYGADWIWFDGQPDTLEAASSCSFYDRQVFMWCHEKFQIK